MDIDDIDRRILVALQRDGRLSNVDLAREVGLSPSPCLRRVRLLEEAGVIMRYVAIVDQAKVNLPLSVYTRVWLDGQDSEKVDVFVDRISRLPQIIECDLMAGDCDFILKIVAADLDAYRRFQVDHLARIPGVRSLKTEIPMQKVKSLRELPV